MKTYVVGTQKNHLNEHPKHMFKLMGKKLMTILRSKILLNWTYVPPLDRSVREVCTFVISTIISCAGPNYLFFFASANYFLLPFQYTVKPVLSDHSKIDKTKVLMTNGSLMKVESIAECSLGAFCNTFDLH